MQGELVGVREGGVAVDAFQRFRDRRVKRPSARLAKLRVDHLLQQRMGKVVADRIHASRLCQDTLGQELVEPGDDLRLGQTGDAGQGFVPRSCADDRSEIREFSRGGRKAIDPRLDDISDRRWEVKGFHFPTSPSAIVVCKRARLDERFERFLDEKRIAARPVIEHRGEMPRTVLVHFERLLDEILNIG